MAYPSSGTRISTDVTNWSTQQRLELLDAIDTIGAKVASVPGDPQTPTVAANSDTHTSLFTTPTTAIDGEVESTGWTEESYLKVMTGLLSKNYVQAAVIMEAISNGTGYVSREKVYEIGNYPTTRSLKGFTRPVNRVTAELVDAGDLPEEADDLLRPDYDTSVKSFQRAKGFFVPLEVVKLAHELKEATEAKKGTA